jgi:hypothetical protein
MNENGWQPHNMGFTPHRIRKYKKVKLVEGEMS